MALEKIQDVGDNAFANGFLNKKFANMVIGRVNLLCAMEVKTGANMGSGKFLYSQEKIILDLSKFGPGNGTLTNFNSWLSGILVVYAIPAQYIGPAVP